MVASVSKMKPCFFWLVLMAAACALLGAEVDEVIPIWRVDEQGLINPAVTALADWTLPAGQTRSFRYRILVYKGSAKPDRLDREFQRFAR